MIGVRKVLALIALGGCSFMTMQSPHGSPPECTESRESPVVDLLLTAATPFVVYAAVTANESPPTQNTDLDLRPLFEAMVITGISATVMAVTGSSSIYGFVKAGRCERVKRLYQQPMPAPPPPGAYVPPPVMPGPTGAPPPQAPLPMVPPGPPPPQ
jgi:hypothetical protein